MELNKKSEVAVQTVEKKARKNASPIVADESIQFKSHYLDNMEVVSKKTPRRIPTSDHSKWQNVDKDEKLKRQKQSNAKYQSEFDKKIYRQFSYKCNAYLEEDLTWILDHNSMGVKEYITSLIRKDMEAHPEKDCYKIPKEVTERVGFMKDATSKQGMTIGAAIKAYKEQQSA